MEDLQFPLATWLLLAAVADSSLLSDVASRRSRRWSSCCAGGCVGCDVAVVVDGQGGSCVVWLSWWVRLSSLRGGAGG